MPRMPGEGRHGSLGGALSGDMPGDIPAGACIRVGGGAAEGAGQPLLVEGVLDMFQDGGLDDVVPLPALCCPEGTRNEGCGLRLGEVDALFALRCWAPNNSKRDDACSVALALLLLPTPPP